jgi:hypothetical protein
MNESDDDLLHAWSGPLLASRRLTFHPVAEGWLARLDGFAMSYGETQHVAVKWTFLMSHKSAYE